MLTGDTFVLNLCYFLKPDALLTELQNKLGYRISQHTVLHSKIEQKELVMNQKCEHLPSVNITIIQTFCPARL